MSAQLLVIGSLFFTILALSMIQKVYQSLGLKYAKITALFFLVVMLVGVNTDPAKDLLAYLI